MILSKINIAPFAPPTHVSVNRQIHTVSFLRIKTKKCTKDKREKEPNLVEAGEEESGHFDDSSYFQQNHPFEGQKEYKFNKEIKCPHQIISIRMCHKGEEGNKRAFNIVGKAACKKLTSIKRQIGQIEEDPNQFCSQRQQQNQKYIHSSLNKAQSNFEVSSINKILKMDDMHLTFYSHSPNNTRRRDVSGDNSYGRINPYTKRQYLHNLVKKHEFLLKNKQQSLGSFSMYS